ncbi:MAG: TldD/PmbA family protein [Spirochaetales bacterium]|nr:TldD/PmbA family protein [Spirochaetales bacterium]
MKLQMSSFLLKHKAGVEKLVRELSQEFEYVSILGCDTKGTRFQHGRSGSSVRESSWAERGFVCRIIDGGSCSEYSFNTLDGQTAPNIRKSAEEARKLSALFPAAPCPTPVEEEWMESRFAEIGEIPSDPGVVLNSLDALMQKGLSLAGFLIDFRVLFEYAHISKIFISPEKNLEQSYLWSQGYLVPIGQNEKGMKYTYRAFSGLKGSELLDEMKEGVKDAVDEVADLLDSERLVPGEYDIICDPAMAGLIAHEAFGHGVEMDMFVKKRALAEEYMEKPVASDKVNMHDGAAAAEQVSSYLFDDEGSRASDTLIIDRGILKAGISDQLSAGRLGTAPTGNGKRESFERKAYSRMTNTFFSPGNDSLEQMISSIEKGYLLENFSSGMEDPKNWGIQCVAVKGREIIGGKLTGRIVSPVYLTGFVPDLLKAISMVSPDFQLSGSGACGKGYKELVKTSTGGPYIKTKGRLA